MSRDTLLMRADSERDPNMLYAVGMFVPDPFIYLRLNGKCHIVVNDFEISRAREEARHCRVLSVGKCLRDVGKNSRRKGTHALVIAHLLKSRRLKKVLVPENFPLALARELRDLKIKVKVKPGMFFEDREFKTAEEVKKISASLMMAEVGLAEGIFALKNSRIGKNKKLLYHSVPLTSEKLRAIIETAVLQAGGIPIRTIVAGGRQGCDPHQSGHGVLRANEPIVLDVFPRSQKTGYFGDITRTVVKGRASEGVRKIYDTVRRGQEVGFGQLRNRASCARVHQRVDDFFKEQGYKTNRKGGRMQGFFHSTGHGVGLELHEKPSLSESSKDLLRPGHVVTIEPGLYYSELGGVRLEDVALVTGNGPKNLTKFEKVLEV
ncbi:MAG TPA: M24 family metallopeptidase [Verrucomicrobiae bacterium]|jgi:Xaa-Pro aminopeptidase